MPSAINALTDSRKISDITKRDIFQLHFPHSDEKTWQKCCGAGFSSLWHRLGCWLSNGVLKRGFLHIYLVTSLEVRNLQNTQGSFVSKYSKVDLDLRNGAKKWEKVFRFLDNYIWPGCDKFLLLRRKYLPSPVIVLKNSLKISYITKRDIFKVHFLQDDKNMRKVPSCRFQHCLGPFGMLSVEQYSETGLFRHFFNHVFCSR